MTYDTENYGNVTKTEFGAENGSKKISSETNYTESVNYIDSTKDPRGNAASFVYYNENNGLLKTITNPNGVESGYEYDAGNRIVKAFCEGTQTNYTYSNGALTNISNSGGVSYNFTRDTFGKISQNKIGNQTISTNKYDSGNGLLRETKHNNNQIERFSYDKLGRIAKREHLSGKKESEFGYIYDNKNRLVQALDSENNLTTKIEYDRFGRIAHTRRSDGVSCDLIFDKFRDFASKTQLKMFKIVQIIQNTFGFSDMLESSEISLEGNSSVFSTYSYDELGRMNSNLVKLNEIGIKHKIEYNDDEQNGRATNFVKSFEAIKNDGTSLNKKYTYVYDKLGNIFEIYENNDQTPKVQYFYDNLNQLIRENNHFIDETIVYNYDLSGNMLKREIYTFTTGDLTSATLKRTVIYNYLDGNWKDQLSSYEILDAATSEKTIHKICHDGVGNTTDYTNDWKFEWTRGKNLAKSLNSCYNIEYKYDDGGTRTQKIVNGVATDFVTSGIQVLAQKTGDDTIIWQIDGNCNNVGFNRGGIQYFYIKNA